MRTDISRKAGLCLAVVALLFAVSAQGQSVIYVNQAASGANDGSTWADAFTSVQDALVAAQPGDEIWVAQGIYRPDQGQSVTEGDREASFRLKNGVALYGGFGGTETAREDRDWEINETVLSGDLLGNDNDNVDAEEPTRQDNSYHVVTAHDLGETTLLDGFTIKSGNANGENLLRRGGGLEMVRSRATLLNVIFTANTAEFGGGFYSLDSNPQLSNLTFENNSARLVAQNGGYTGKGGGMFNASSSPRLTDITFRNNEAADGGGLFNQDSEPYLLHTIFDSNTALSGGGMYDANGAPIIINARFVGNVATCCGGGGLVNDASSLALVNVIFSGNRAHNLPGVTLGGGGMLNYQAQAVLVNVVFSLNQADTDGGGLWNSLSMVTSSNSIIWDNTATQGAEVFNLDDNAITFSHSILGSSLPEGATDAGGNLFSDPLFNDPDGLDDLPGTLDDDVRLQMGSPAIDAGDNMALPADSLDLDGDGSVTEPLPIDLDSHQRIFDGGGGTAIVDMGVYEFNAPPVQTYVETAPTAIPAEAKVEWTIYPNPFRNQATLQFRTTQRIRLKVTLHDLLGREVLLLYEGIARPSREETIMINVSKFAGGVYHVRLYGEAINATKSLVVIR